MNSATSLILVVDDLPANRETLYALLDAPDFRVVDAADGPTALRLAADLRPDIVLLDLMMPGMDGCEVCRRLRANPRVAEVPIIIITSLDDSDARLAGLEAGADDFVTKPFNVAELRARVRTVTRLNRFRRLLEAQTALQESEARFRQLAEHSEDVFWFTALDPERVTFVSPAVEKVWGLPPAHFYADARLWEKCLHPDDRPRTHAAYEAMLASKAERFAEEFRIIRPDGSVRWVHDRATPIRDAATGLILTIGGVARDISDRKEAEERLLRAQRLENLGTLAAGIAHDFSNALAPILMAAPLLRAEITKPASRSILDTVETCAERGAGLVRQILSFARGVGGGGQLLQPRHLLHEIGELATLTFPKSIQVNTDLPGDLWPIRASATQLHQVCLNLCVNARDAMPRGGELELVAANCRLDPAAAASIPDGRPGAFLRIAISDTGTGIPADVLPRIWEPFFTTKDEGKGTGLGLSTVRGILQQHGGFAEVKTAQGRGTTFAIYLPAAEPSGEAAPPHPAAFPLGRGELILVVDDDPLVRDLTAKTLAMHGYRTLTACDGAEAIAVFASHAAEVQLVLTDLDMPLVAGPALAAALRRLQPKLPMIAMSGAGSRGSTGHAQFTTAFLAKPFQHGTLLTLVHSALAAVGAGAGAGTNGATSPA